MTLTEADIPSDPQAELRRWFVQTHREYERRSAELLASGIPSWDIARHINFSFAPFAELRCGAKGKRTGKPCALTSIYGNGRCKFHGGLSTGPKTAAGKATAALNGKAGRPRRQQPARPAAKATRTVERWEFRKGVGLVRVR